MTQEVKQAPEVLSQAGQTRNGNTYRPHVDILETAEGLTLMVDVPGANADAIDVQFEQGTLTIHAKVTPRAFPEGGKMVLEEFGVGDFYRTFQVSEQIDATKIAASYMNGVLRLDLPKIEAVKPRRISVQTS
jgi:HSP20 family protein